MNKDEKNVTNFTAVQITGTYLYPALKSTLYLFPSYLYFCRVPS
jgi:hypothetical protein